MMLGNAFRKSMEILIWKGWDNIPEFIKKDLRESPEDYEVEEKPIV